MDIIIVVLGILFLCGVPVGKALAICAIIEGLAVLSLSILKKIKK